MIEVTQYPLEFFAGFRKNEIVFKREDLVIDNITDNGVGFAEVLITGGAAYADQLKTGDIIYVKSELYDFTTDIFSSLVTGADIIVIVNYPYIDDTAGGYCNFLKNFYIEVQFVNQQNTFIPLLPYTLKSVGSLAGVIKCDVSEPNILNTGQPIFEGFGNGTEFKIKYRAKALDYSINYSLIPETFTVVYSTAIINDATVPNVQNVPLLVQGYACPVGLLYERTGKSTLFVASTINEIDKNGITLAIGTDSHSFESNAFGLLTWCPGLTNIESGTEFVKVIFSNETLT